MMNMLIAFILATSWLQYATAQSTATAPPPSSTPSCPAYMLLTARDQGEPQGPSSAFAGAVNKTLAAVPGGTTIDVVYPADPSVVGANRGLVWIQNLLGAQYRACGKPPNKMPAIVLLGYGWGGNLMSLAAAQLRLQVGPRAKALKALVLAGSLMHTPNRKGNVDEKGGDSTASARGPSASDNPPWLDKMANAGALLDVCATGDPYCDFGASDITAHAKYGTEPTVSMIADFVSKAVRA